MAAEDAVRVGACLFAVPGADRAGKARRPHGGWKPSAARIIPHKGRALPDLVVREAAYDKVSDPGMPLYHGALFRAVLYEKEVPQGMV